MDLHALGVGVEFIVFDNDSSMRVHLHHIATYRNGNLPLDMYQPSFLYDPSHRIKCMVKDIFELDLMGKGKSECEKIDALQIKKYTEYWIAKSKLLSFEHQTLPNAPVETLFVCNEWCDTNLSRS